MADDLVKNSLPAIKKRLKMMYNQGEFGVDSDFFVCLVETVLGMRQIVDSFPSQKLLPYFSAFGPTNPSDQFLSCCSRLDLYIWDIFGRVAAVREWAQYSSNQSTLEKVFEALRRMRYIAKSYFHSIQLIESKFLLPEKKERDKEKKDKKKVVDQGPRKATILINIPINVCYQFSFLFFFFWKYIYRRKSIQKNF
eukprot:TRINITY_DN8630_c0_g1_i5.p1 TRINITY_DN8630_c0_g1~~TRINITY_DN8630_c0_g1_i5.p1  ORF type:complete len:229 (-),score=41.63 TRINITY_DN8630_c0_g1_i5:606-1190(-)